MIIGPRTASYILIERPSIGQLERWVGNNLEGPEKERLEEWIVLASQTTRGNTDKRPSSILAHKFEAITEPPRELDERLRVQLDNALGKAEATHQVTPPQSGSGSPSGQGVE